MSPAECHHIAAGAAAPRRLSPSYQRTGTLTIHGYDAMLKASDVWLTPDYATANWPMPQRQAAEDIAHRIVGPDT